MKGIFSVLVENRSGVLSKTAGLFARRGFNIDSLAVGETEDQFTSSMTIVSTGDERTLEQIEKQLNKKLDIIKVRRLDEISCLKREVMMVKINHNKSNRADIVNICTLTGAKVAQTLDQTLIIEYYGAPDQVDDLIEQLRAFGIIELVRTGTLALQKES